MPMLTNKLMVSPPEWHPSWMECRRPERVIDSSHSYCPLPVSLLLLVHILNWSAAATENACVLQTCKGWHSNVIAVKFFLAWLKSGMHSQQNGLKYSAEPAFVGG